MAEIKKEIGGSIIQSIQACERRAAYSLWHKACREEGMELNDIADSIAARKGTAFHSGAEFALKAKLDGVLVSKVAVENAILQGLETGNPERGDVTPLDQVVLDEKGGETDTLDKAKNQLKKLVKPLMDVLPEIEPAEIEPEIRRSIEGTDWTKVIHPDVIDTKHNLIDFKTGYTYEPKDYTGQVGLYLDTLEECGYDIDKAQILYFKRVGVRTEVSPPALWVDIPKEPAKAHARDLLARFINAAEAFFDTTDKYYLNPRMFRANTSDPLCSQKYCRAFGTRSCEITMGRVK